MADGDADSDTFSFTLTTLALSPPFHPQSPANGPSPKPAAGSLPIRIDLSFRPGAPLLTTLIVSLADYLLAQPLQWSTLL